MQSQRFFIGNLPPGTTEKDVNKAFKDYGDVTNIELKEKENLIDPGSVKLLVFVTLNLYDTDVDYCLGKLNAKPINGQYVKVSVAKESFLERLKREREENSKASPTSSPKTAVVNYIQPLNKSKKVFNDDDDDEEDSVKETAYNPFDDSEPLLISKKRAANSIRNGKIVIEGINGTPLHVIGKQKEIKQLSDKSFLSDKKRKESVNNKVNQYKLQKSLIQKSLSSVDASKTQKIVFHDNDDGDAGDEDNPDKSSNAKQLFDGDSDEDDSFANDFKIKPEYEGLNGAALMRLQTRTNLDPRFKIDHKFGDKIEEPVQSESTERDWQYGILEQVTGSKVSQPIKKERNKIKMLRYDPSKHNQEDLLVKTQGEPIKEDKDTVVNNVPEVSKEVFYMVSDNLSNTLKTRGDGFSLLSMFGKAEDENDKNIEFKAEEKILIKKSNKSLGLNPFTYDSSASENEADDNVEIERGHEKIDTNDGKGNIREPKMKVFVESFFISRNDVRLKEGKAFFRAAEKSQQAESYDKIKDKLKGIINTKINKTKRQQKGPIRKKKIRGR